MTAMLESITTHRIHFFWTECEKDGALVLHAIYADGSRGPVLLPEEIHAQTAEELIAELAA
jgi:hypothetical protein